MQPDSDIERRFRRTHISQHDFTRAGEFIAAACSHDVATVEHEALLIAAIICYARPFSANEKHKKGEKPPSDPELDASLLGFDDAEDLELHNKIIKLRNKAVAHAEFDNYPVMLGGTGLTIISGAWHVVDEQLDLLRFQWIASEMGARCTISVYEDAVLR